MLETVKTIDIVNLMDNEVILHGNRFDESHSPFFTLDGWKFGEYIRNKETGSLYYYDGVQNWRVQNCDEPVGFWVDNFLGENLNAESKAMYNSVHKNIFKLPKFKYEVNFRRKYLFHAIDEYLSFNHICGMIKYLWDKLYPNGRPKGISSIKRFEWYHPDDIYLDMMGFINAVNKFRTNGNKPSTARPIDVTYFLEHYAYHVDKQYIVKAYCWHPDVRKYFGIQEDYEAYWEYKGQRDFSELIVP